MARCATDALPVEHAVTWDTSFEQLDWAARYLLNLLCWLAPEPVPRALTAVKLRNRTRTWEKLLSSWPAYLWSSGRRATKPFAFIA